MDDCSFKSQDIGQLLLQFIQTHLREKKEGFNSFGRTTLFEINKTQERGIEVSLQFRSRGSKKTTSSRIQIEVYYRDLKKICKKSPPKLLNILFSNRKIYVIGNRETFPNIQCLYFYLYSQSLPIKYKLINSHIALVSSLKK